MSEEDSNSTVTTMIIRPSRSLERISETCPQCGSLVNVSTLLPLSEIICNQCQGVFLARRVFNRFQIEELLGRGGMGAVYKALDVALGRRVALKVLRDEFSNDATFVTRLAEEAKITASINHPNVIRVFGQGACHGMYYITFEYIKGGSLTHLIAVEGRLPELRVLRIGIQIASALRAATSKGLVHRDVKPGNILMADANTAKLVDFGLSSFRGDVATGIDEVWGSPHYLAPEKLDGLEDLRSDIYSLGATLFHALAGRPVFEGEGNDAIAFKHLECRAVSIQTFAPEVSNATTYCLKRMLERDPVDRYQSYDDLIEHLEFARDELCRSLEPANPVNAPKAAPLLLANHIAETEEKQRAIYGAVATLLAIIAIASGIGIYLERDKIAAARGIDVEFASSSAAARLKILSAKYGDPAMRHSADITTNLRRALESGVNSIILSNVEAAGGMDPALNIRKETVITYTVNGERKQKIFPEDYTLSFKDDLQ